MGSVGQRTHANLVPNRFPSRPRCCSGDGSRLPSEDEKEFAKAYGIKFGNVVKAYVAGKSA